jgi:hypothetical protein
VRNGLREEPKPRLPIETRCKRDADWRGGIATGVTIRILAAQGEKERGASIKCELPRHFNQVQQSCRTRPLRYIKKYFGIVTSDNRWDEKVDPRSRMALSYR